MSPPKYKSLLSSKRQCYDSNAQASPVTRKSWTVGNLVKHDDYWKLEKLIVEGQLDPTRAFVDQCYGNFASVNILKVLAKYGAPMKPSSTLELEPVCHYAIAYYLKRKSMNSRRREKYLEVIRYLKNEGHPVESTNYCLSMLKFSTCDEMSSLLTPSVDLEASPPALSPASTDSSTASTVSTASSTTSSSKGDAEDVQTDVDGAAATQLSDAAKSVNAKACDAIAGEDTVATATVVEDMLPEFAK